MKIHADIVLILTLSLLAHSSNAGETTISTEIRGGMDYSDRAFDDDTGAEGESTPLGQEGVPPPESSDPTPPPENSDSAPPSDSGDSQNMMIPDRDDERFRIVISPTVNIMTKSSSYSAMLSYRPDISYDLIESESADVNHETSAGFSKALTENWSFKIHNLFRNTDEYENHGNGEESPDDAFLEESTSSISSMNETLRDELGRRRYSQNELNISTGYDYRDNSRLALCFGWEHLGYDEAETASDTYQDYDKFNVTLAASHCINDLWTIGGYGQYLRGLYETDDASNDDLTEYHLGSTIETRVIPSHPITLGYDVSEANYGDTIDSSTMHRLKLGCQVISSETLEVRLGAGPTYTEISNSEDSWAANGNLNVRYTIGRGAVSLTSDIGTRFDNFSGTDERGLTDYWRSRAEYAFTVNGAWQTSLYAGHSNETRDEIDLGAETDVERISTGGSLEFRISDSCNAGLNYDYSDQNSNRSEDSYNEHTVRLMMSWQPDLFSW